VARHHRAGLLSQLRREHRRPGAERKRLHMLPSEVRLRRPLRQLRQQHAPDARCRRSYVLPPELRARVPV